MNANIRDYDTDKPIILETGKPPIKRETEITKNEQGKISEKQESELQDIILQMKCSFDSLATSFNNFQQESVKSEIVTETKPTLAWWQKTLIWCGAVFIALIIYALYKTIKQRLNTFKNGKN